MRDLYTNRMGQSRWKPPQSLTCLKQESGNFEYWKRLSTNLGRIHITALVFFACRSWRSNIVGLQEPLWNTPYLLGLGWSCGRDVVKLVFDSVPDLSSLVPSQKNNWCLDSAEWKSVVMVPYFHAKKWNGCGCSFNLELDELRSENNCWCRWKLGCRNSSSAWWFG
jgi:hypothetical protein